MKLEVTNIQGNGFTEVALSHKGERLLWTTTTYGKVKLNDPLRVFDDINGYWAWMEGEHPKAMDAVWACYVEIKEYLENSIDPFHISRYIRQQITLMYQSMPMDTFAHWLLTKGGLYVPPTIQDSMSPDSRYPRSDQTYLTEDYINLTTLALAIRPILPVWGEFIDPNRQGGTNDLYKEMEAVGLIVDTPIIEWPPEEPAFEKLQNYIRISAENTPLTLGSLVKGIGSAEIPLWLHAKVMVRRLPIVPLCDHQVTHSIIANIYQYVDSNLKPTNRRSTDQVRDKDLEKKGGGDDDDKTSFLEEYKVKQRVADGDVVLLNVDSENMAGLAQKVDPTMDLNLLTYTTDGLAKVEPLRIFPHQIRLAQWVLAKSYSPRAFYHVNKAAVNRLLATAQALLWHWGYLDIACFMQVEQINATVQDIPGITQRPRGGSRIARKYDPDLLALYPHSKPQRISARNREQPQNVEAINRSNNYAAIGINNITRELLRYNWYYHGPKQLKAVSDQPDGSRLLVVPPKIKDQITELSIHLAKLNQ